MVLSRPIQDGIIESRTDIENRFGIQYLTELEFSTPEIVKKVERRCRRKLFWSKYRKMNAWAKSLFEKEMLKKKEAPIFIKKVNAIIGYGVYAKETITPFQFIGEYTGIVRKRKRRADLLNDYIFGYVIGPHDTPWVIDAQEKGNFTRFINHSYEPNLISRWIIYEGIGHVILFAKERIEKGQQLTYDYGPYYWRKRSFPQYI